MCKAKKETFLIYLPNSTDKDGNKLYTFVYEEQKRLKIFFLLFLSLFFDFLFYCFWLSVVFRNIHLFVWNIRVGNLWISMMKFYIFLFLFFTFASQGKEKREKLLVEWLKIMHNSRHSFSLLMTFVLLLNVMFRKIKSRKRNPVPFLLLHALALDYL